MELDESLDVSETLRKKYCCAGVLKYCRALRESKATQEDIFLTQFDIFTM